MVEKFTVCLYCLPRFGNSTTKTPVAPNIFGIDCLQYFRERTLIIAVQQCRTSILCKIYNCTLIPLCVFGDLKLGIELIKVGSVILDCMTSLGGIMRSCSTSSNLPLVTK